MPFSTPVFKQETFDYLVNKFNPSSTILDVGAGAGYYSKLLKGTFPNMDAIEIFEPYIRQYQLRLKYNNVWNENILTFEFDHYDIIYFGDFPYSLLLLSPSAKSIQKT
jgi:16S rRNA A1518/A1519 N6-dimethyltransferase RsmA/KsgA/DIM1 with predicted DNA glycosylase/AP lyase activity